MVASARIDLARSFRVDTACNPPDDTTRREDFSGTTNSDGRRENKIGGGTKLGR